MSEVILQIVELVEERNSNELNETKGAVIYDGWTRYGKDYVGMFLSYCSEIKYIENGSIRSKSIPRNTLIAISPMSYDEDSDETSPETEATKLNSKILLNSFRNQMEFYQKSFNDWCVCLVDDSCKNNLKIAKDFRKPHIGCYSHNRNIEISKMLNDTVTIRETIKSVINTMSCARRKLKNAALLRNTTALKAIIGNETRWSRVCCGAMRADKPGRKEEAPEVSGHPFPGSWGNVVERGEVGVMGTTHKKGRERAISRTWQGRL